MIQNSTRWEALAPFRTQCKCSASWTSDFLYLPGPNLDVLKMYKLIFEVISADFRGPDALIGPSKFLKQKQKHRNTVIRKFPFEDRANVAHCRSKWAYLAWLYHARQKAKGKMGHRRRRERVFQTLKLQFLASIIPQGNPRVQFKIPRYCIYCI